MVAYNFQKRFIDPIRAGTKRQTIRAQRRLHACEGVWMQLYYGQRTKHCEKIIEDQVCSHVVPIKIVIGPRSFLYIEVLGLPMPSDMFDAFAVKDGFENAADMHEFFLRLYGKGTFNGLLIGWNDGTKEALAA